MVATALVYLRARGGRAATRLRGMSTSPPRRRRDPRLRGTCCPRRYRASSSFKAVETPKGTLVVAGDTLPAPEKANLFSDTLSPVNNYARPDTFAPRESARPLSPAPLMKDSPADAQISPDT